jgi:hypothetical protein
LGGGNVLLTVRPYEEAVRITSAKSFTGGKLSVVVRSGAVMPGIITSIYLASGNGRHGDAATGTQDEIDLEWKGNAPTMVQTNVFLDGQEDLQVRVFFAVSCVFHEIHIYLCVVETNTPRWPPHAEICGPVGRERGRMGPACHAIFLA